MSDQTPTTPAAPGPPPAAEAPPAKEPRPRPSWIQMAVAVGALVAVLAVAAIGFAIGRVTAGDDGDVRRGPMQGERFDGQRGPGGPGMMPPALPPNDEDDS
jgi:hypothetical protein